VVPALNGVIDEGTESVEERETTRQLHDFMSSLDQDAGASNT
jgi:hypothetical protein